jgi:Tol biopolymer transport system component
MLELSQPVARGKTRALVLALPLLLGTPSVATLVSELRAQEVPKVKPQYTRLFGADTLSISQAAISPDGRWIAFTHGESDRQNLWLTSVEGGEPVRLTGGRYYDADPKWFPAGDRLAFRSTRPAGPQQDKDYVMTLGIDPDIGEPVGPPRQITLERPLFYALSPDGKWIAYSMWEGESDRRRALKVLPANGGSPRTILSRRMGPLAFSEDGDSIYFAGYLGASRGILRVSVDGGEPEVISAGVEFENFRFSPGARRFAHVIDETGEERTVEVATIDGQPLAHLTVPKRMRLLGYAPDDALLLAITDVVAPLRVMPVSGGAPRQLTEAQAYDIPLAWRPDGEEIFFSTRLNGHGVFMLAPLNGGAMRQVPLPSADSAGIVSGPKLSGTGRHVLYGSLNEDRHTGSLRIFDLEDETSRDLTRSFWTNRYWDVALDGEHFVYWELGDDRYELRSVYPTGSPRTLWSFPKDEEPPAVAVRGDRVAFVGASGDASTLYVGSAGAEVAVPALTVDGEIYIEPAAWAPDGTRIVVVALRGSVMTDALVVGVTPEGRRVGEPRALNLTGGPKWWWDMRWLPDGSGFTVLGQGAEGMVDTEVWLVSLDPETPPLALTKDEQGTIWRYALSPDGRHIAYSIEVPRGSSLWCVDLEEVRQGAGN